MAIELSRRAMLAASLPMSPPPSTHGRTAAPLHEVACKLGRA